MQKQKDKENISGKVRIVENKIYWDYFNKTILEIDVNNIVVIGEYTNTNGPWFDDWFITFVTKDGNWQSIPWYVENRDQLTHFLCNQFQSDLNVSFLTSSTIWDSVVRFPATLKGQKLFITTPSDKYKVPKSLLDKIVSSIGFGSFDTSFTVDITDNVKNEVRNACR
jgi:hypothetical protein